MNDKIYSVLKSKREMDPETHDGCYEFVRSVVEAYRDEDLSPAFP